MQLKETEANLALEEIRKELLAEQEKVRTLWEKSELDGRRVAELEGSLETQGSELEELKGKHLKLVENNYLASSDLTGSRRQLEGGFAGIAAASADIMTRMKQFDPATDPPALAPDCQSLPTVAEFISKAAAHIRTLKNKTARRHLNDQNGPVNARRLG